MARRYVVVGPSASGTGPKTAATIIAASTVRIKLYDIAVGSSTTPADQTFQFTVGRFTAVGTAASNPTPLPLDPNEAAALSTVGITHSAEPTYTAGGSLLDLSINQRASFRWVAAPGSELMAPASANNGLGIVNTLASAALVLRVTGMYEE